MNPTSVSLAILIVLFAPAAFARTLECETIDSTKNITATECISDTAHLQSLYTTGERLPWTILAAIPLIEAIGTLLIYPFFFCFRQVCNCCCGGRSRKPDAICCGGGDLSEEQKEELYTPGSVKRTKCCSVFVWFLSIVAALLLLFGAINLRDAYGQLFDEAREVITWVDTQKNGIQTTMTIDGAIVPPLTIQFFWDLGNQTQDLRDQITEFEDAYVAYFAYIRLTVIILALLPILFTGVTVLAAICNGRTCVLCCNSCFHCWFLILYGIVGFIFLLLGTVFTDVCGERTAFLNNETGIISMDLVNDKCASGLPFSQFDREIQDAVVTNSRASCQSMMEICDTDPVFNASSSIIYQCQLTNATTQCTTVDEVNFHSNAMVMKAGSTTQCSVDVNNCTLANCASQCPAGKEKNSAQDAVDNLQFATASFTAYWYNVRPLMDCNQLISALVSPLTVCDKFTEAFYLIGGGSFMMATWLLLGMCVICRGQKRFFSRTDKPEAPPEARHPYSSGSEINSGKVEPREQAAQQENATEYEEVEEDEEEAEFEEVEVTDDDN